MDHCVNLTVVLYTATLLSMAKQTEGKLNRLERLLPEGLLVDASWLTEQGYSTSLRRQYVTAGWLTQPTRQVYQRRRGSVSWQQAVVSLQMLLGERLVVGGRTALDLQGFSHYLTSTVQEVHLYGPEHAPTWLYKLPLDVRFVYHNSEKLFPTATPTKSLALSAEIEPTDFVKQPWGPWGWQLCMASPERAILELLDELPDRESFYQVDKLFEGLANLSPRKVENLLARCRNVKVKRLFFYFADRHKHAWLKRIDRTMINLGKGKRLLVRGGRLDTTYLITVPEDLDAPA